MKPSPLEHAILVEYHNAFRRQGFPPPEEVDVLVRENSGAGRFVDLKAPMTSITEHACVLPHEVVIEMDGVENGLGFMMFVQEGRLDMLELYTFDGSWDGEERPWRLVNRGPAEATHA